MMITLRFIKHSVLKKGTIEISDLSIENLHFYGGFSTTGYPKMAFWDLLVGEQFYPHQVNQVEGTKPRLGDRRPKIYDDASTSRMKYSSR